MRALLAFDKFKDSLSALQACETAAAALREQQSDWQLDLCPLADGGEGFAEILTHAAHGTLMPVVATGPRGDPVDATFGLVATADIPPAARALLRRSARAGHPAPEPETLAIIEMAAVSGLALLSDGRRDPWHASTVGTGQLMAAAHAAGAQAILLGVGGSATSDLGLGALAALGLEFHSARGERISSPVPSRWHEIDRIAGAVRAGTPPILIACDVSNPLLGPQGAAAIYGPQKGLKPGDVSKLDHAAARLALLLSAHTGVSDSLMDRPGAGAAGGIAFGLMAAAGAELIPGFDLVSAWLDLQSRIEAADVIITGEGRFDASSLSGKGPGAVAAHGLALHKPVHIFAGQVSTTDPRPGLHLHAITPPGQPLDLALAHAAENLRAAITGSEIGN